MMRLPLTLSIYFGRQFLLTILATIGVMVVIVGLMELLELIRRAAEGGHNVPFGMLLQMAALKLPATAEKIYPFAVMIGGMVTLSRLTRLSELAVARAAGVSVWQFLAPGVLVALALGVLFTTVMNPIGAYAVGRFERLEGKYISNQVSQLSVLPSGLWLHQSMLAAKGDSPAQEEYIIHAVRMNQTDYSLEQVMVLFYDVQGRFTSRVDAASARLMPGNWMVEGATLSTPEALPKTMPSLAIPTTLTIRQIQDSFSAPETFSFWQLPGFIRVLEQAGFSALQHRLHFHSLMAMPLLLAGMILLSAVFSLRPPRRGRTGVLVVTGLVVGFFIYFMTNIIYALGSGGDLPIALAAWAPCIIVIMTASAMLLHLEDG